jgi:hypothetical protein
MASHFAKLGTCLLGTMLLAAWSPGPLIARDGDGGRGGGSARSGSAPSGRTEGGRMDNAIQPRQVPNPGNDAIQTSPNERQSQSFSRDSRENRQGITEGRQWQGGAWEGRREGHFNDWGHLYPWYGWYGFGRPAYYGYGHGYGGNGYVYDGSEAYEEETPVVAADLRSQAFAAFRQGNYDQAARLAGHLLVDDPRSADGHLMLMLATFALRDYRTAAMEAHAVASIGRIPDWPALIANYPNVETYTEQLRALESFVGSHSSAPEGRFLLGFQYLMEGHRDAAQQQIAQAAKLVPHDRLAQQLMGEAGSPLRRAATPGPISR